MRVETGDTIDGRFVLGKELGGGMTRVFRAEDVARGVPVAVKILADAPAIDLERFAREAALVASLAPSERGIARYVTHGTVTGASYLVLDWVDGSTLAEWLETRGLSIAESVRVARDVSRILATVHGVGLVHRDVKPDNVIFTAGGLDRATLIDFGIARHANTATAITRTGAAIGTPGYMAPEQARGAKTVDARADVFALGCVLYECLTGRRAFEGEHVTALCAKVMMVAPPPLGDVAREVPRELEDLLWRMMAKDPAARPADGAAVYAALAAVPDADLPDAPRRRTGQPASPTIKLAAAEPETVEWLILAAATAAPPEVTPATGLAVLADGAMVARVSGIGVDGAAAAVQCAITLRELAPDTPIAITCSHRAAARGRTELDDVIDRGVRILELGAAGAAAIQDVPVGAIFLDDHTAELLTGRFDVRRTEYGWYHLVHP